MTTDHNLFAALTFALLAGGMAAIGTEMLSPRHPAPLVATATTMVTLPTVTVIGRRPASTALAAEARVGQPQQVQ